VLKDFILTTPLALGLSAEDALTEAAMFKHHHRMDVVQPHDNSTCRIQNPHQLLEYNQRSMVTLLTNLCHRGLVVDVSSGSTVVLIGTVGKQLLKREVIPLILTLLQRSTSSGSGKGGDASGSDDHESNSFMARHAVECLNCLTRSRDCRVSMLMAYHASSTADDVVDCDGDVNEDEEKDKHSDKESCVESTEQEKHDLQQSSGEGMIRLLLTHPEPVAVSHGFVVVMHLLWDTEWQQICAHMAAPSIVVMAVTWAAAAIQAMERIAAQRRDIHHIKMFMPEKKQTSASAADTRKLSAEELDYESFKKAYPKHAHSLMSTGYPTYEARDSDALLLLSRCVLMLQHVSPMHIPTSCDTHKDVTRMRVKDLLVSCIDLNFIEMDCYSAAGLHSFAMSQHLRPADLRDPQGFMNTFIELLYATRYFHYEDNPSMPHPQLNNMQIAILGCLLQPPVEVLWRPFIQKAKQVQVRHVGALIATELSGMFFKMAKESGAHTASRSKGKSLRDMQQESIPQAVKTLQHLSQCAHCNKVETKKKAFSVCSRCKSVHYCGAR
jgi:hypothetical protein